MKNEGEFARKQPKRADFVQKSAILAAWRNKNYADFTLFYRLYRDALYMVGGWRDRTDLRSFLLLASTVGGKALNRFSSFVAYLHMPIRQIDSPTYQKQDI